ncbi:TrkH family potassium uptake protein [Ruminococcus albus]|uniref:Trk system potassium uptake protein TrkH n=1 Tax=Ruminococcus albus TaxID=1264 RepID=A0A1H7NHW0_RUMAL|nr:potassium transporter TrkG [Ruminococcus albus]SEL23086.1 trk system potassium uptake protein TrkH [Ruminococcus albus]
MMKLKLNEREHLHLPHIFEHGILRKMSFTQSLMFGYSIVIMVGALLLCLPISTTERVRTPLNHCVFTTTSALSGTGLTLHDTYTYWSLFGQIVILIIIQIGGIGFMSIGLFALSFMGKKIGLKQRATMRESIGSVSSGGVVKMTRFILKGTALFESLGTAALCFWFVPRLGWAKGIYFSLFHSISAFCTAGLDLMGYFEPGSSLITANDSVILNIPIIILLVVGGIGFFTWSDIVTHKHHIKKYSAQTKIILVVTVLFYLFGMLDMALLEWHNDATMGDLGYGGKVIASSMLVTSGRDAGFASVTVANLRQTSIMLLICFMFVGGSPGSTACGIKVTTFAVMMMTISTVFRKKKSVEFFGRRVDDTTVRNASCITTLYLVLVAVSAMIITGVDGLELTPVVFELVSAISSTGLSMGITTSLSDISIFIVIMIMFFGRVGGITFIVSLHNNYASNKSQLPEEKIML